MTTGLTDFARRMRMAVVVMGVVGMPGVVVEMLSPVRMVTMIRVVMQRTVVFLRAICMAVSGIAMCDRMMSVAMIMRVMVVRVCKRQAVLGIGAKEPVQQRASLAPEQPGAKRADQCVAHDFEEPCRVGHGHGRAAQHKINQRHHRYCGRRLQEGREEGQRDPPAQRHFIGEHIGRDDRLAVTGAGCMKDAVSERQADQNPELRAVLTHRLERAGQRAIEGLLLDIDPVEPRRKQAGRGEGRFVCADAE